MDAILNIPAYEDDIYAWAEKCAANILKSKSKENCANCMHYSLDGCKCKTGSNNDRDYRKIKFYQCETCIDFRRV